LLLKNNLIALNNWTRFESEIRGPFQATHLEEILVIRVVVCRESFLGIEQKIYVPVDYISKLKQSLTSTAGGTLLSPVCFIGEC
jgi:hypothetical protein